jgi:RNA polymerase sigma factor (sigma-70 family)
VRALQPGRFLAGERGLRAWLATVARNLARRRWRDESVRRAHDRAQEHASRREGREEDAAAELERLQLQRAVADAVLALREPYRSAVLLRYEAGLDYEALARRLGIESAAARQRVSRGLALLREKLDADHGGERAAWCAMLAPLLAPVSSPVPPASAAGTGAASASAWNASSTGNASLSLGGLVMGAKLLSAAGLAVAIGTGTAVYLIAREPRESSSAPLVAKEPAPLRAAQEQPLVHAPADSTAVERRAADSHAAAPADVDLEAVDRERDLHGRVVGQDGEPVAGARILVRFDELGSFSTFDTLVDPIADPTGDSTGDARETEPLAETVADASGEFAIPLERGRLFELEVEAAGFAPALLRDRLAGEHVVVRLGAPAVLEGRVARAADGSAVAGARVEADSGGKKLATRTDAQGRFQLRGLAPGALTAKAFAAGLADASPFVAEVAPGAKLQHEFLLGQGIAISGRFTDADTGQPIEGALLGQSWTFSHAVRTDAAGDYSIQGFSHLGHYDLNAKASGYERQNRALNDLRGAQARIDFALRRARSVVGRVVGEDGAPLAGVYVAAQGRSADPDEHASDWSSTRSDAGGRFELEGLGPDLLHSVLFARAGLASAVYDLPVSELEQPVTDIGEIVLASGAVVGGAVVDDEGRPIPDCRMLLLGSNSDRGRLGSGTGTSSDGGLSTRSSRADDLGRFAFADVAPGEYVVSAQLPDSHEFARANVRVVGRGAVDVRLELSTGGAVAGILRDPDGKGVAGVYVHLDAETPAEQESAFAFSGADGAFRIAGLRGDSYHLQAVPTAMDGGKDLPDLSGLELTGIRPGEKLELVLPRVPITSGRVFDADGLAVANASVAAYDAAGEMLDLEFTNLEGSFALKLPMGAQADLVAKPPPEGEPFYLFKEVDEALGVRAGGVASGTRDLLLQLPRGK